MAANDALVLQRLKLDTILDPVNTGLYHHPLMHLPYQARLVVTGQ